MAFNPESRTIAIAPFPGAVDIAHIVDWSIINNSFKFEKMFYAFSRYRINKDS
jgi:hypothetical protein